jgi:hypothetical protein
MTEVESSPKGTLGMPQHFSHYDKVSRKKRLTSLTDFVDKYDEEIMQKLIIQN